MDDEADFSVKDDYATVYTGHKVAAVAWLNASEVSSWQIRRLC
jgi:hypothetical protein